MHPLAVILAKSLTAEQYKAAVVTARAGTIRTLMFGGALMPLLLLASALDLNTGPVYAFVRGFCAGVAFALMVLFGSAMIAAWRKRPRAT